MRSNRVVWSSDCQCQSQGVWSQHPLTQCGKGQVKRDFFPLTKYQLQNCVSGPWGEMFSHSVYVYRYLTWGTVTWGWLVPRSSMHLLVHNRDIEELRSGHPVLNFNNTVWAMDRTSVEPQVAQWFFQIPASNVDIQWWAGVPREKSRAASCQDSGMSLSE